MNRYARLSRNGIYRSRSGMILGVCKGLAQHFDFSVFWTRVIALILLCVAGFFPAIGLYLLGNSPASIYLLMAVVGVGWASIVSLPFAIFSQKIGKDEMGLYMGLFNLSVVLPQLVVSLGISLLVSRADDLRIIFIVSAIALAISTLSWTRVREN